MTGTSALSERFLGAAEGVARRTREAVPGADVNEQQLADQPGFPQLLSGLSAVSENGSEASLPLRAKPEPLEASFALRLRELARTAGVLFPVEELNVGQGPQPPVELAALLAAIQPTAPLPTTGKPDEATEPAAPADPRSDGRLSFLASALVAELAADANTSIDSLDPVSGEVSAVDVPNALSGTIALGGTGNPTTEKAIVVAYPDGPTYAIGSAPIASTVIDRVSAEAALADISGQAAPKASVVRQETHFAPIAYASIEPQETVSPATSAPGDAVALADENHGPAIKSARRAPPTTTGALSTQPAEEPDGTTLAAAANADTISDDDVVERGRERSERLATRHDVLTRDGRAGDFGAPAKAATETAFSRLDQIQANAQAAPTQQIADRIAAELEGAEPSTDRADQSSAGANPGGGSPVKILHLQLSPADLGTVTLRLSLKGDALSIELDVSRHGTAQLLKNDRDALSSILRAAGYAVDGVTVQIADLDRSLASLAQSGSQGGQATAQASTQSDLGAGQQQDGRPADGRSSAQQEDRDLPRRPETDGSEARHQPAVGNGLYI